MCVSVKGTAGKEKKSWTCEAWKCELEYARPEQLAQETVPRKGREISDQRYSVDHCCRMK